MTQTPLDRLKLVSFQVAQWWAFINACCYLYVLLIMLLATYGDVPEWGYILFVEYIDFWDGVGLDKEWTRFMPMLFSPILWLILWITTGSPRFLPWKPLRGKES